MNVVNLIGRLTKDIELRTLPSGSIVTDFTLAVNRRKKDDGADFIGCVAWGKLAELMNQYMKKGDRICVSGHLNQRKYTDKNGIDRTAINVIVEDFEFIEKLNRQKQENFPANDLPVSDVNGYVDGKLP